ncbi:armadillo-type protein [Aspergillus ambiguus]|uniref:putative GTP binding protein n=1 Tax=Aspergillus ambiguus TaxID=176160 RepID=UPI003CCCE934
MSGLNEGTAIPVKRLDTPPLSQIIADLGPLPQALSVEASTLSPSEEETLFDALQKRLKDADTGDNTTVGSFFKDIPVTLEKLWNARSRYLSQATEALANGSRTPSWRLPYGQTGILSFFLQLLASNEAVDTSIQLHSLRLVGNSCADTDENRAIVVKDNYTAAIMRQLLNPELVKVVIPVIYNLCIDNEPAQSQVAANKIVYIILKLLKDGAFEDNDTLMTFAYELMELVAEQEKGIEQSPTGTLSLLIDLALDKEATPSISQFSTIVTCLAAYLDHKRFQDICISNHLNDILSVLQRSLAIGADQPSQEDIQALSQLRLKLNQTLAEVSASPLFADIYPVGSPLSHTLKTWLTSTQDHLQICACVMLGNLARSDEVCARMVHDLHIHKDLIHILNSDARGAVLHAALGFLKNLAIAGDNKLALGAADIIPAIARLWSYETIPEVQFAATTIARQLILASIENIARLLDTAPADTNNDDDGSSHQTYLSLLLVLSRKTDAAPIKTEIGRIVASICRTVVPKSRDGDAAARSLLDCLFRVHDAIATPLADMITQTEWPVVRSEGWFAMALMASEDRGAVVVAQCLQMQNLLPMIEEALGGTPAEAADAEKLRLTKDRDNIVVLVRELLKNETSSLPDDWKENVQSLVNAHVSRQLTDGSA